MGSHSGEPLESDDRVEPGDEGTEDLYQDELDAGRAAEPRGAPRGASDGRANDRRGGPPPVSLVLEKLAGA